MFSRYLFKLSGILTTMIWSTRVTSRLILCHIIFL